MQGQEGHVSTELFTEVKLGQIPQQDSRQDTPVLHCHVDSR